MNKNTYFELVSNEKMLVKATTESQIDIFSSIDYHFITSLNTKYDSGGNRIAISDDSKLLFCCGYYYGIQAIALKSKEVIWKTSKIKSIQKIELSNDGEYLYVLTETEKLFTIESYSRSIIEEEKGIRDFYKTDYLGLIFRKKNHLYSKLSEKTNLICALENPILAICSFQNDIIVSEMYKPLKRVNFITGDEIWISDLKPGFRINHMKSINNDTIAMLGKYSVLKENENHLFILNSVTGEVIKKTQIDSKYHTFCYSHDGLKLFCSDEDVFDTITHKLISKTTNQSVF